jgi:hypothetical protein
MHVKYIQDNFTSYDMVYQYVHDNSHGLTIYVNFMVKCVCYMGLGSNGSFMASVALTGSHYKTDIINGVSHSRSDSVMQLVLCTVAYNIQGTSVIL